MRKKKQLNAVLILSLQKILRVNNYRDNQRYGSRKQNHIQVQIP